MIADLALRRDEVMAQARKLALELDETVDGLETEIGNRRPAQRRRGRGAGGRGGRGGSMADG